MSSLWCSFKGLKSSWNVKNFVPDDLITCTTTCPGHILDVFRGCLKSERSHKLVKENMREKKKVNHLFLLFYPWFMSCSVSSSHIRTWMASPFRIQWKISSISDGFQVTTTIDCQQNNFCKTQIENKIRKKTSKTLVLHLMLCPHIHMHLAGHMQAQMCSGAHS